MKNNKLWLLVPAVAVILLTATLFTPALPDHVAARIDGEAITFEALDLFVAVARQRNASADRESVLKGLLENRILANKFTGQSSEAAPSLVGYDRDTQLEQQLFRLIRSAFSESLQNDMRNTGTGDVLDFLTAPLSIDTEYLAPALRLQQQLYTSMTPQQQQQAKNLVLARYRFHPQQAERQLTLWDLYRRQNMQLKVQMHNLNQDFIREAIRQQLTMEFVLDWFERQSGVSELSRTIIKQCVEDALVRESGLRQMGLLQDIHDENPKLQALARQVTAEEIANYYWRHRDKFTRVEKVHAYHIRLDSQELADQVYAEIQGGLSFAEAVTRYSQAEDKASGGALGWIDRNSREDHWSKALAFVQTPHQVSRPVRSPQNGKVLYWEILLVDQRETGFQPADGESVRYRAANAIAQQKLQQTFQQLLHESREAAHIEIHREINRKNAS
ncbi:peptidylprolyl isomerase [Microbulbifer sp. ALW1]|uniref:peptidylprolyl isomerase n=1 Tax=Microbulbifer sp. (strain ALW1) TaxID=1516059 RepID=UPI001359DDAA|nr:peptidylprolyl isomerase [Microbulbifer sp. ALW1]